MCKVFWMSGLSGAGKTTISLEIRQLLANEEDMMVRLIDGDRVRCGLNADLGYSLKDKKENVRRVAEMAKLFPDVGVPVICSFMSPTREIRDMARRIIGEDYFVGIFVDSPLATCESRDVKGLYKRARNGELKNFTGIDGLWEPPTDDEGYHVINTNGVDLDDSVEKLRRISRSRTSRSSM